ncbi:MAG: flagellar protein FliT [Chthonomonadetes bacterium]|nr:flagellar protein FliT [Chthonomonadetes bacterium]
MPPDEDHYWQKWLMKHAERVRLLYALQEEAIRENRWDALSQIQQEQEEILQDLWQAPPSQLPPEVLAFAQEIWQTNLRLQRMVEEQMRALQAEMADVNRSRNVLNRYNTPAPSGRLEDRAA